MSNLDVPGGEVLVYSAPDGSVRVDVRLERETVWLSQRQMAELLGTTSDNVGLHLKGIFDEGELVTAATTEDFSVVQVEGRRRVRRQVKHYNLDAIISVGYRVNSRRGTQFRIWATRTLREHLLAGYTLNERRLAERGLGEIEQAVDLLSRTLTSHALVTDEGRAVLDVVQRYTRAWRLLLEYDEDRLAATPAQPVSPATLSLSAARTAIAGLRDSITTRGEAGPLFGQERGEALAGLLGAIEQTFDGKALYPNAQTRAAHLLYFAIKDHPFSDGNKRIGTLLFLDYLRRNRLLLRGDGSPRLADNAMVALALLIAESGPSQKDLMIRLVLNLLGDEVQ
ncbi:MAG TPA: virulence protein RhuM/Fic/DOC family protein [Planctomycetota bacterium]|nr:virulence protein RhuM/Fic/DOC family protein [Planctomycetota bacterium]